MSNNGTQQHSGKTFRGFTPSGKGNPCPVCDRTKDGDCRTGESDNVVLCHTHITAKQGDRIGEYTYLRESKDSLWGVWIYQRISTNGKISGRKPPRVQERERYYYRDRKGSHFVSVERVPKDEGKAFYQYHWSGTEWVPGMPDDFRYSVPIYRYTEVRKAIAEGKPIFVVEGEAKCDSLWKLGIAATTTLGGSKKYRNYGKGYKADLDGAELVLCPDWDKVGVAHMEDISRDFPEASWCRVFPKSPVWSALPDDHGLDVGDWIAQGATSEEILAAVEKKAEQESAEKTATADGLKAAIAAHVKIEDPFEIAISENEIGKTYNVRGSRLETLVDYYNLQNSERATFTLADLSISTYNEIEQRSLHGRPTGLTCGFFDLDSMTQGFQRKDLIVVAGRPSMGKTAFVTCVARNLAAFHNQPILFVSLEMSKEQVTYRLLASESRIDSGRLRAGRVGQNEWDVLAKGMETLATLPIVIDDVSQSVSQIEQKALEIQEEHGEMGAIAVDYMQLMAGKSDNQAQEVGKISKGMKGIAKKFDCPVFGLSQLSRGVESRTNKRPMMSDLRESGAIEQDADLIMMLYRDEYYNPDTPDRGVAEVILAKHRNGPVGTVKLLFEPQFTQFRNMPAGYCPFSYQKSSIGG